MFDFLFPFSTSIKVSWKLLLYGLQVNIHFFYTRLPPFLPCTTPLLWEDLLLLPWPSFHDPVKSLKDVTGCLLLDLLHILLTIVLTWLMSCQYLIPGLCAIRDPYISIVCVLLCTLCLSYHPKYPSQTKCKTCSIKTSWRPVSVLLQVILHFKYSNHDVPSSR